MVKFKFSKIEFINHILNDPKNLVNNTEKCVFSRNLPDKKTNFFLRAKEKEFMLNYSKGKFVAYKKLVKVLIKNCFGKKLTIISMI